MDHDRSLFRSVISCSMALGIFEQEETEITEEGVRLDLLGGFAPLHEICFFELAA